MIVMMFKILKFGVDRDVAANSGLSAAEIDKFSNNVYYQYAVSQAPNGLN